ncbi:uncharacterized protein LOC130656435 isoform X1 [Hydractinia symbiolongicarpus]|uniref:uncharacterized protein LOC130626108 n=2 Tax=Hydractinia symbiolongicarpus TaxID=13093 RepID=UPI00254C9530|nr:uncharacterized protein LOC130612644 isoform X1 [Hydractinia symbiolongicarpus]XP_057297197.1 uncharacterized protein LOC130626108 [Hydractinia symbiolongicarpus]XP_057299573.1 uncharacterized protein LOC130630191 isoform X1 [Hydractinia symbiolongicarpus]XP_057299894.1 uncharacterized protein LOC130630423 isoform X1 [Hydractinia symbiolongicarpus]XP_057300006.1 uncharacterized protein LOC130630502 isoform X1 [Hydractinia symbiolongicarpus]XP_057301082.1 uncharacterized protein LOC130635681
MTKRVLQKPAWKEALGASMRSKRLKLMPDKDNRFCCPVADCDSESYGSKRGCRKHVYNRHGWFYYFDKRPNIDEVLPHFSTRNRIKDPQRKRASTFSMPSFAKTCNLAVAFRTWLKSPGGGGKDHSQADQITCKVLKYAKYCCEDSPSVWEVPFPVIDYCVGSINMLSDFVDFLRDQWKVGFSGIIGYMNAIGHMLDYRRSTGTTEKNLSVFVAAEIYLHRVKKFLLRKMKAEWKCILSVEYLNSIDCWATLYDLQKVIPYHSEKYKQIVLNAKNASACVAAHDLSFSTSFIVAVLFLMVKASRPMTYQTLTVTMIKGVKEDGFIDQNVFKTAEKYGFDSLYFSIDVLTLINEYIDNVRRRLNPTNDYLLVCRNGKQLTRISDVFGRIVYQAIGKYINPTRYRQIIETESVAHLETKEQAILSQDQKHTSQVAKVHYQKTESRNIAAKARLCMDKLRDQTTCTLTVSEINSNTKNVKTSGSTLEHETPVQTRQKKVSFSAMEDKFLQAGLQKYGNAKWTSILADPNYSFHCSRKASTLAVRAKTKQFI